MVIFVLREMYLGKVISWERRNRKSEEQTELVDKIEAEEKYFTEKMSLDDCQRFQKLVNLYTQLGSSEEGEIFAFGFSMGAVLMKDILEEADFMQSE